MTTERYARYLNYVINDSMNKLLMINDVKHFSRKMLHCFSEWTDSYFIPL